MKIQPCKVPWSLRPTFGTTLVQHFTDEMAICKVFVLSVIEKAVQHSPQILVELNFEDCRDLRLTEETCWDCTPSILEFAFFPQQFHDDPDAYLHWFETTWQASENCPDPGFYYVPESTWRDSVHSRLRQDYIHFVLPTESGFYEFLAKRCAWKTYDSTTLPKVFQDFIEPLTLLQCGTLT